MSSFANVNVGTIANDGSGTALRAAFQIINQNFAEITAGNANIAVNAPVQSVAGRTGNVQLHVTDVQDAVSSYYVLTQIAAGNAYVNSVASTFANANVSLLSTRVDVIDANLGVATTRISTLTANAGTQQTTINSHTSSISSINANLGNTAANVSSLSSTVSSLNTAVAANQTTLNNLESNAASQGSAINSLRANVTAANAAIVTVTAAWTANAQTQAAQLDATNAAIVTANTGMKSYVDAVTTSWTANAASQGSAINSLRSNITAANAAIITANVGMKSYVDYLNAVMTANVATVTNDHNNLTGALDNINELLANTISQEDEINNLTTSLDFVNSNVASLTASTTSAINGLRANITAANAAIVTANVNMKGYVDYNVQQVDDQVHTVSTALVGVINGQAAANTAIITANTGMKSYVDALNASMVSNISTVANDHNNLNGALNNIVALYSNAALQSNQINLINANVSAANARIALNTGTINTLLGDVAYLTDTLTNGPIAIYNSITADEIASNGAMYATTGFFWSNGSAYSTSGYTGNIAIENYTISTINDAGGNFGITLSPANGGEIHLSNYTGILNSNPAWPLEVGNYTEDENYGAVGITFNNNVPSTGQRHGTTIIGWDIWDNNGHGTNDDGTDHARFGIFKDGDYTTPFITFDNTTTDAELAGNLTVLGNVAYTMGNSANWNTSPTTVAAALDELAARLKAAGF